MRVMAVIDAIRLRDELTSVIEDVTALTSNAELSGERSESASMAG